MNREIKFRAWDKRTGRWIDNFRMFMHGNIEVFTSYANPQWQPYSKKHYELMQYTGLKDKNGKEIFEGDILEVVIDNDNDETCGHGFDIDVGKKVAVRWMDGGFRLIEPQYYNNEDKGYCEVCAAVNSGGYLYSENHEMDIGFFVKVVGNIYESPELLK